MIEHTKVTRKTTNEDRIALCPQLGCETIKRVKPLKLGFIGFGKYPKCKQHHLPLVYIDERIGEIVDAALACLFDKAGLPPNVLLTLIKENFPKELSAFIKSWVYCITIGRGAPIISSYMDSLSNSYLKQITKKQLKVLKGDTNIKSGKKKGQVFDTIKRGMDEITLQYTRLLKHLRVHSEVLVNTQEILPLSTKLRNALNAWLEVSSKEETELLKIEKKQDIPLSQVKNYYDRILNLGTCRCLLGLPSVEKNNKKRRVSAFERFSAYLEFWKEHLTEKYTKSDIEALEFNNQKDLQYIMDIKKEPDLQDMIETSDNTEIQVFLKGAKFIKDTLLDNYNRTKSKIFLSIIEYVTSLKDSLIKEVEYPFLKPKKILRQKKLFSHKGYYMKGEPGFTETLKKGRYEALIYKIKCDLPKSPYNGKIYIGITGRSLKTRFKEHVIEAIRECDRTHNTPGVGYTKLYQAIANSLILVGWGIELLYDKMRSITGQQYHTLSYKVIKSIENTHIFPEIIEVHEYMDTAHDREKHYTKTLNTVKNGLNEYEGGGYKGKHLGLPLYDIALMIAFGKNLHQITRILKKHNFEVSRTTVGKRILHFFGGWYEAQVKFLKPIIEQLILEGYKGYEIYRTFEGIAGQHQTTWFNDWCWGETFLDSEIANIQKILEKNGIKDPNPQIIFDNIDINYFGIPKSQWIKWAVEDISLNDLINKYNFSKKTLVEIYKKIGGSHEEVQTKYRRSMAIDLIKNLGWTIEKVYTDAFKRAPNTPLKRVRSLARDYFENVLFPNSSVEEIYKKYNKFLLDKYLKYKARARPKPSKRMEDIKKYPKGLDEPFPQEFVENGYFSLKMNKREIHNFPKFLRYIIVGFIYKSLKEEPFIPKDLLLQKICNFSETRKLTKLSKALKNPKFSEPVKEYLQFLIILIREIKRRVEFSKPIYRSHIIKYFKNKGIELQVSPPIINDIIWTIKNFFPDDFN